MTARRSRPARISLLSTAAFAAACLLAGCAQMAPYVPTGGHEPTSPGPVAAAGGPTGAQSPDSSSAASSPGASPPASEAPPKQVSAAAKAATAQLGVQIYWHDIDDAATAKKNVDRLLDYVVGLGANSVAFSFPIYTDGAKPTRTYTTPGKTPSAATLTLLLTEAKARGLRTMLRPLIDEANILDGKGAWRGSIQPVSTSGWFASYQALLNPFLDVAQRTHTDSFVVGAELDSLVKDGSNWKALAAASGQRYSGQLSYADNWGQWVTGRAGVPGVTNAVDAYPVLHGVSDSSSVAQLTSAWTAWLRHRSSSTLAKTFMQEVGISATDGAYAEPVKWEVPGEAVKPAIQANWFAAACQAAKATHMSGIYFWDLDAYADPAQGPTYGAGSFIGRGDVSIKTCFATGWSGQ